MDKVILTYLGCFLGLLVLLYIKAVFDRRQRRSRFLQKLDEEWGQPSKREYSYEEFDKVTHYFYLKNQTDFCIDDITWKDLDMDRLYKQMNQTYSSFGEEYLYNLLRTPCFDKKELARRDTYIRYFQENEADRKLVQEIFGNMGKTRRVSVIGYLTQFEDLQVKSPWKYYAHQLAMAGSVVGMFFAPAIAIFAVIAALAWNVTTYYREKREIEMYLEAFSYISNVLGKTELFLQVESEFLKPYAQKLVQKAKSLKRFQRGRLLLKSGGSLSGGLEDVVMDYVRLLFHVDLQQFNRMLKELYVHKEELLSLYEEMGYLESMIVTASYRTFLKTYTAPEFTRQSIEAEGVYHPLITSPVPNSIQTDRSVLLTGSNASGKSTFLKTMAINAILAQTIYTAAAEVFRMPLVRVYSSMALQDHLESEESYYIVEIKSLKRIVDAAGEVPVLCFIDEVLRGTNTVERIAASTEILSSLGGQNIFCFAATHDIELTYLLKDCYDNYHFSEEVRDGEVLFSYKLQKGPATSRNAIQLLEVMGYQPQIIRRARERAAYFVEHNTWKL